MKVFSDSKLETIIKQSEDFLDTERTVAIGFICGVMRHALKEYKTLSKKDKDILIKSLKQGM